MTPGKYSLKNFGRFSGGSEESVAKWTAGAKSVQVKDLSREGMAMNMKEPAGQMCRWLGEIAKSEEAVGWMRNSHQSVSMYSCW